MLFSKKILVFFILIFAFVGCTGQNNSKVLKIGHCTWPGYEPLVLASEKQYFKTPVKLIRFSSPQKAYKAFKNGAVDVVALTTDELIKYADYGDAPKIFLILDISLGADAIVGKSDITLDNIKGKSIALESSVLAKYMLSRFLDKHNLKKEDMKIKNIEIVDQPQAYKNNESDLFVTFEPSKSEILAHNGKVLFDSSEIPNEIIDALAANKKTWNENQQGLQDVIQGWYKALEFLEKNPDEAHRMMGKYEGLDAKSFQQSLEGIKLGDKASNEALIHNKELINSLQKIEKLLREENILHNPIEIDKFIE